MVDISSSGTSPGEVHGTLDKITDPESSVAASNGSSGDHVTTRKDGDNDELEDSNDDQIKTIAIRPEPLMQQDADPLDVEGGLQLIESCREGNTNAVTQQVRSGIPAGFITKSGWTPVAAAAYSGAIDVLLFLLELGADGMYETSGRSPKSRLPNQLASVTKVINCNTPLHWACYKGHVDAVSILLAAGYNHEAVDTSGNRCLHLACSGGHRDVVEQLLAHSATIESRNKYGNRPLDLATEPSCRRLLMRFQSHTTCEWCKETFSRLRRPSLCQHCHNVFCNTKPCSSSFPSSTQRHFPEIQASESGHAEDMSSSPTRTMRYCQECASEMRKAEQDLRNVLESKLELIRRTLAVLDPSISSNNTSAPAYPNVSNEGNGVGQNSGDDEGEAGGLSPPNEGENVSAQSIEARAALPTSIESAVFESHQSSAPTVQDGIELSPINANPIPLHNNTSFDDEQKPLDFAQTTKQHCSLPSTETILSALTLTRTDAEALYTALETAQLRAADIELVRFSRQTYQQLVAHVALQEEVKSLFAERPIGIRSMLEPLTRALHHATHEQVHPVMLSVALQVIQSAEAECTLFGCHTLCQKIDRGSRCYSKDIARLEASLMDAQLRGVDGKLLNAAGALYDRLNAEVRLEACLLPFESLSLDSFAPPLKSGRYVFSDGTIFDTLLQALEHRVQLVSSAIDTGTRIDGVSATLLDEANIVLKQLKKETRDEARVEEERRKAEEEAALKAAKKNKKKKKAK